MRDVLGPHVLVTRPVIKGDLRIVGLDDSVITDEVEEVLAEIGGCKDTDVRVGQIRPMSNGLFMLWAQCPFAAAIKASSGGKIRIGWTMAEIELLKSRPV